MERDVLWYKRAVYKAKENVNTTSNQPRTHEPDGFFLKRLWRAFWLLSVRWFWSPRVWGFMLFIIFILHIWLLMNNEKGDPLRGIVRGRQQWYRAKDDRKVYEIVYEKSIKYWLTNDWFTGTSKYPRCRYGNPVCDSSFSSVPSSNWDEGWSIDLSFTFWG